MNVHSPLLQQLVWPWQSRTVCAFAQLEQVRQQQAHQLGLVVDARTHLWPTQLLLPGWIAPPSWWYLCPLASCVAANAHSVAQQHLKKEKKKRDWIRNSRILAKLINQTHPFQKADPLGSIGVWLLQESCSWQQWLWDDPTHHQAFPPLHAELPLRNTWWSCWRRATLCRGWGRSRLGKSRKRAGKIWANKAVQHQVWVCDFDC